MASPMWFVALLKRTFRGIFTLARLTRVPGVGRLVDRALFFGDDLLILPRDRVIALDRVIPEVEHQVLPSQVVEHFVRQTPHRWLMNSCICRDAAGCRDYPAELGCLFLGRAALEINPRLGRPVGQAEALDHLRRCREAGLVHLVGRNKLDTVWLNVGPGHRLLTVCSCCPCCCLWRILPHISPRVGEKVHRMPGIEVTVTQDCIGCGTCTENVCFADAIAIEDGRAVIGERCRGCGRCVEVCPNGAIELRVIDPAFADRTLQRLLAAVNLQ